jgi:uncharacterized LabA/DUF88 family protein
MCASKHAYDMPFLCYATCMSGQKNNSAYVDGQNLHMGTSKSVPEWHIDLAKFRVYLAEKYHVTKAYYYLGYVQEGESIEKLYETIQRAGFILVFRQHTSVMLGEKKGNVDSDIIFSVMKSIYLNEEFDNIVLVSGDGDYKMLVDFLIEQDKFEKILFPNRQYRSSLYNALSQTYFAYLDDKDVRRKIEKKRKGSLR